MRKYFEVLVLLFILSACGKQVDKVTDNLEIGRKYTAYDLISVKENNRLTFENDKTYFTPTELGEIEVKIIIKDGDAINEDYYTFNVIDTEKPNVKIKMPLEFGLNTKIDFYDYFEIIDNSGENLIDKLEIRNIDTSIIGENELQLLVKDSSGNSFQKKYTYKVHKPVETVNFEKESISVNIGSRYKLDYKYEPIGSYYANLEWESDNIDVASVGDFGILEAKNVGKANVSVKLDSRILDTIIIIVQEKAVETDSSISSSKYSYLEGVWKSQERYLKFEVNWPLILVYYVNSTDSPKESDFNSIGFVNTDEKDGIYLMPYGFNTNRFYKISYVNNILIIEPIDAIDNLYGGEYTKK